MDKFDVHGCVLQGSDVSYTDELYPVAGASSLTAASGYAEICYARPRNVALNITGNL